MQTLLLLKCRGEAMATILIVEDDRLFRWAVTQALQAAGYAVREASNQSEARQGFDSRVDLAILDYYLPGPNGTCILREMRTARPDLPVLMLTAHATKEGEDEAVALGARRYATKPDDPQEVVRMVRSVLGGERDSPRRRGFFADA